MASRNTFAEAQELKAQFKQDYPGIKIIVLSSKTERRMGRAVAERKGFEIVEDSGGIMVTVKETRFEILEARTCGCGKEYTTRAIGEIDSGKCDKCSKVGAQRHGQELSEGVQRENERTAKVVAMNDWELS